MLNSIMHRGPDSQGVFVHNDCCLGMRRLSILDVEAGHQPQFSADGRYAIVYNGEIYNYKEIQSSLCLEGVSFQNNSDTEVVLHLFERLGPDCLQHFRGMFAFAILDTLSGAIFIARDRMGVKPLYYFRSNKMLLVASEIKALLAHPIISHRLNPVALDTYLALRYVPGPECLLQGIRKFPAAHWMIWKDGAEKIQRYWRPSLEESPNMSDGEALGRFGELFDESTRLRMLSERPVGLFLSGGLDSTAIAVSVRHSFRVPLKTFCVGFGWKGDELSTAADTARQLGYEHHEVVCQREDTALLPRIAWHLDEPLGDAIVLPMYLLSKLASQHVTVVQSGEGADELLGGYFMHRVTLWAAAYSRYMPDILHRTGLIPMVHAMPAGLLNRLFDYPGDLGETGKQRLLCFLRALKGAGPRERYNSIISLFSQDERDNLLHKDILAKFQRPGFAQEKAQTGALNLNSMLAMQFEHWLPDDILCKLDKLTMAHSLEGRVPFMDHKLVEFLLSLPARQRLTLRQNKIVLRRWLAQHFRSDFSTRRKVPFYIPVEKYLAEEPLRGVVAHYLDEKRIREAGLFNAHEVEKLRRLSKNHGVLVGKKLFALLMFELWREQFLGVKA